jgi:hypothetical protein
MSLLLAPTFAQNPFDDFRNFRQRPTLVRPEATGPSFGEFHFRPDNLRFALRQLPPPRHVGGRFFLKRTTTSSWLARMGGDESEDRPRPEQVPIMDDKLFDYPMIYFVEPGFLELSDEQAARLREYVARGGFMFFDDFWGDYEWQNLETQLHKIWPDRQAKDLPLSHPVFHSYLDIDEIVAGAEHHERAARR